MAASDTLKKVAVAPAVGARLPAIDDDAVCQMHRHRWPRNLGELLQVLRLFSNRRYLIPSAPFATSSVLAAMMKSLRCRPLIEWLHQVTVTLPHSVSSPGW